jgi:hypothetical protein
MNKRGQFFLVAAIILATIFIGLTAVYNSASPLQKDYATKELAEQFSFDSKKLAVEYMNEKRDFDLEPTINGMGDLGNQLEELTKRYSIVFDNYEFYLFFYSELYKSPPYSIENFAYYRGGVLGEPLFIGEKNGNAMEIKYVSDGNIYYSLPIVKDEGLRAINNIHVAVIKKGDRNDERIIEVR